MSEQAFTVSGRSYAMKYLCALALSGTLGLTIITMRSDAATLVPQVNVPPPHVKVTTPKVTPLATGGHIKGFSSGSGAGKVRFNEIGSATGGAGAGKIK
jgi:hypothetical protein